jgi:putative hydrolase of the HAD superfamily
MNQVNTIIFDLGGVVVSSFGKQLMEKAEAVLGIPQDEIRPHFPAVEPFLQAGKIHDLTFWKLIVTRAKQKGLLPLDRQFSEDQLRSIWLEPYKETKVYEEILRLADALKAEGYEVVAFSNTQEPHPTVDKERGVYDHFSQVIRSDEIGFRKPNATAFKRTLQKLGKEPEETLLIEDSETNRQGAEAVGMHTILHQEGDTESLLEKLSHELELEPPVQERIRNAIFIEQPPSIERRT